MKKLYTLIGLFLTTLLVSSCEGILEQQPFSQLSEEQFWRNNADAASGVTAIYDGMQKTYNTKYYSWGEFRADNFVRSATPTADGLELLNNALTPTNAGSLRWNTFYLMIARANIAIANIPKIPNYDRQLLGEAHAVRAYAYFHAIRVWGDVPLYTEPVTGLDQEIKKPKSKAAEIMTQLIIPDMLKAESLLTQNTNTYRFSKAGVWSLQAEVYMFLKDFAKAKVALTNIVRLGTFSLVTTRDAWLKQFLNDPGQGGKFQTSSEFIFNIRYSVTEDSDRSGIYAVFFAGLPTYYINPVLERKWVAQFPTDSVGWYKLYPTFPPKTKDAAGKTFFGDWRYVESREAGRDFGLARVAKYTKINISPSFDDTDIIVYRYANTLTLLAEAENQLGNKDAAIALMNQLRTARQLPTVRAADFTTKEQLENFILDERQMEFLAEGVRWWDLRRTGKAVQVMGPINGQTEKRLLFPIFDRHLFDNPLLTQTEGY